MRIRASRILMVVALGACLATGLWLTGRYGAAYASEPPPTDSPQVQRARRQVQMLDDLYKTAIVLINDTYVADATMTSAGEVARELFGAMRQKGWHDVRLIDATGEPINEDNHPRDTFERTAAEKVRGGDAYYEEIVREGDKSFLRAATVVPVVNQRCVACHPTHKVGDILGAVSYKLAIE